MARKKKNNKVHIECCDVKIVSRLAQRRAGLNIPETYGLQNILEAVEITKEPQYILWNNGEPIANKVGGIDVIAYLYYDNNTLKGWSV